MVVCCLSVGCLLVVFWLSVGYLLTVCWLSVACILVVCWLSVGCLLVIYWLTIGSLFFVCLLVVCCLSIGYHLAIIWFSVGFLLVFCWFSVGFLLVVCWLLHMLWVVYCLGGSGSVKWQQISEDLVPVNIACVSNNPQLVFHITAYNSQVSWAVRLIDRHYADGQNMDRHSDYILID